MSPQKKNYGLTTQKIAIYASENPFSAKNRPKKPLSKA